MSGRFASAGSIAVIGGGVSGLACARSLADRGYPVTVFDRGRGPGGRLATRAVSGGEERTRTFDHGAPFFSTTSEPFDRVVRAWRDEGVCALWDARRATWRDGALATTVASSPLVVGVPGMSAVCRHLAGDIDVRTGAAVTRLDGDGDAWTLRIDPRHGALATAGPFAAVVIAAPAPQALRLIDARWPALATALTAIEMEPVWVGLLCIEPRLDDLPDVIDVLDDDVIARLIRDDAKPGRVPAAGHSRWIAHARPEWSRQSYDAPAADVGRRLARAAARVLSAVQGASLDAPRASFSAAHRWGFAQPRRPVREACLADDERKLLVCGDGFGGSGVEAAFLSGRAAARWAARAASSSEDIGLW